MSAKRCQDAPKSDLGAILARFWTPRGRPNLDFRCNCRRKSRFSCFSKGVGKRDPNRPLGDENGSQERPGGAQEAPREAKSDPGEPREPPQRPKKGATKVTTSVCALRGAREPPGSHLGAILERFGSPRGSIFKPFSFHFAMLEAREAFQATPLQDAERGRGARPRSLTRTPSLTRTLS